MKSFYRNIILFLGLSLSLTDSFAQMADNIFVAPFDFPLYLSGNFGELRTDHFHSGVDFKTQGVEGKPIKCVADGYICRASVTYGGYGNALYVMHDNGYMSVYAHLESFPSAVDRRVREYQYRNETFKADLWFAPNEFRVKQGAFLAYAGNSGYSFGPHLHFEIRNAKGEELYDPMTFYKDKLIDTRPPRIHAVSIYPKRGRGIINGASTPCYYDVVSDTLDAVIEAWGDVAFGVKALDYMDGTGNKYGIRDMKLFVDGELLFSSLMDNFSFDENLLINAWIDYGQMYYNDEWYQKMFVSDNNSLRLLNVGENRGWLNISEERDYNVEYCLSDYHGNITRCSFIVRGKKETIPTPSSYTHALYCGADNRVDYVGLRLDVPEGALFEDAFLNVKLLDSDGITWRYALTDTVYPMLNGAKLSLWVGKELPVDESKLYIRHIEPDDSSSVGGVYKNGWITADINTLDCYDVAVDTVAPKLLPVEENMWKSKGKVVLAFEENETSLKSYKGTLDGEYILFGYNSKNKEFTLDLKKEKIAPGVYTLKLVAVDECGNMAVYEKDMDF